MWNPFRARKYAIPRSEKRELEHVKRRVDRLEPRVAVIESQLRLYRREP